MYKKGNVTDHPLYNTWRKIKEKHHDKGNIVTMCDEWLNSFWQFIKDIGYKPSNNYYLKQMTRSLPYKKGNVMWVKRATPEKIIVLKASSLGKSTTIKDNKVKGYDVKGYDTNDDMPDLS